MMAYLQHEQLNTWPCLLPKAIRSAFTASIKCFHFISSLSVLACSFSADACFLQPCKYNLMHNNDKSTNRQPEPDSTTAAQSWRQVKILAAAGSSDRRATLRI